MNPPRVSFCSHIPTHVHSTVTCIYTDAVDWHKKPIGRTVLVHFFISPCTVHDVCQVPDCSNSIWANRPHLYKAASLWINNNNKSSTTHSHIYKLVYTHIIINNNETLCICVWSQHGMNSPRLQWVAAFINHVQPRKFDFISSCFATQQTFRLSHDTS